MSEETLNFSGETSLQKHVNEVQSGLHAAHCSQTAVQQVIPNTLDQNH